MSNPLDAMRNTCSALQLLTVAFGSYLSSLLITIVAKVTTMMVLNNGLAEKHQTSMLIGFNLLLGLGSELTVQYNHAFML
ncbi:unnamed protein product [Sphenostylis stenocarpa]|uniref:Uncharacterized protein n=1 Tax=Sphenostylis stenocarpa TaxID=92480 RepID=A0AA86V847_9FABA|nr:unnamed protein product [Sphenostylis stenocarpa]